MRRFESSRPSQAVRLSDRLPSKCERSPRKAGFHTIDSRLYTPISSFSVAKLPKISGRHLVQLFSEFQALGLRSYFTIQ